MSLAENACALTSRGGSRRQHPWRDLLVLAMDWIRIGLAGGLSDYPLIDRHGNEVVGGQVDYLGHTVTVAGWKGELEFGTEQEDTSGWMIDEPEVASRLRNKTLYIVTRDRNVDRLKALSPVPLRVLMRNSRDVLLTNAKKVL